MADSLQKFGPQVQNLFNKAKDLFFEGAKHGESQNYLLAGDRISQGVEMLRAAISLMPACTERTKLVERADYFHARALEYSKKNRTEMPTVSCDQIDIPEGATGFSYETIFGRYLDERVSSVFIQDPYLLVPHQVMNLVRFCEMLITRAPNLRRIELRTKENKMRAEFDDLARDLSNRKIQFTVSYDGSLHDRLVRFDNGYHIKPGRGLDIYQRMPSNYAIGAFDYNFRPCKSCTIEIKKTAVPR